MFRSRPRLPLGWRRFLQAQFARLYRWNMAWERRLEPQGFLLLFIIAVSQTVALDLRHTMAYQIFSLGVALMVVTLLSGRRRPGPIRMRRFVPPVCRVGETLRYTVEMTNLSKKTQRRLFFREHFHVSFPTAETVDRARFAWEKRINIVDRFLGYPRWRWIVEQSIPFVPRPTEEFTLLGGETVSVEAALTPRRRGIYYLDRADIGRRDPFRFWRRLYPVRQRQSLTILPRLARFSGFSLPERGRTDPDGERLSRGGGDSQEFAGIREYRPYDQPRHIHWKSTAKHDRPIVKEFQDDRYTRLMVFVDTETAEPFSDCWEGVVSLAAAFLESYRPRRQVITLTMLTPGPRRVETSPGETDHALVELAALQSVPHCRWGEFLDGLWLHEADTTGYMLFFQRWDDNRKTLVDKLQQLGADYHGYWVYDNDKEKRDTELPPGIEALPLSRLWPRKEPS